MIDIRPEQPADFEAIHQVVTQAFGRTAEADLVNSLRAAGKAVISLVATEADHIVGHILFSPVTLVADKLPVSSDESVADESYCPALGLAPLAVLPEWQKRGIGSRLTEAGLELCRQHKADCVVVLGHSAYYPRFGFGPASRYSVRCEYDVPDEVFMLIELRAGALQAFIGTAKYQPEFADF